MKYSIIQTVDQKYSSKLGFLPAAKSVMGGNLRSSTLTPLFLDFFANEPAVGIKE
jgi:hypothetical protein